MAPPTTTRHQAGTGLDVHISSRTRIIYQDFLHLEPFRSMGTIESTDPGFVDSFTLESRVRFRLAREIGSLSDILVNLNELEPLTAGMAGDVVNEANEAHLADYRLLSPPTPPDRLVSLVLENGSLQPSSVPLTSTLSLQTLNNDTVSNGDFDFDESVSTQLNVMRAQVLIMAGEAYRLADDLEYFAAGITTNRIGEPERPSLRPINPRIDRFHNEANRPRPVFPIYLMDEYLEEASRFDENGLQQSFTERHRENIMPPTESHATTAQIASNDDVDGEDSWVDPEPSMEIPAAANQNAPQDSATRQRQSIDRPNGNLLFQTMVFTSFR